MNISAITASKSVTEPAGYLADRRRGMGRTDAEIAYLARLRQRLTVAVRMGDRKAERAARRELAAYKARVATAAPSLKEGGSGSRS